MLTPINVLVFMLLSHRYWELYNQSYFPLCTDYPKAQSEICGKLLVNELWLFHYLVVMVESLPYYWCNLIFFFLCSAFLDIQLLILFDFVNLIFIWFACHGTGQAIIFLLKTSLLSITWAFDILSHFLLHNSFFIQHM